MPPAKQGAIRSLLSYRGDLLLAISGATTDYSIPPRTYAKYFGAAVVWRVVPPPAAEGSK